MSRFQEVTDGLRVSDQGDVESCWEEDGQHSRKTDTWHRLKPFLKKTGYLCVFFRGEHYVHRLVLEAFAGLCPPGLQARHVNGVKTDNRLENLQWGTYLQNAGDRVAHKEGRTVGRIPSYRRHRASGQAVVTLNGVDHYLGTFGTEASKAAYDRLTSEWLTRGRRLAGHRGADPLVKEVVLGFYEHCAATMSAVEVQKVKLAMKPVRSMYGEAPASAFGPVAFKAIRSKLIAASLAISTIRDRMGTIRRMVAWAVENEMAPADALQRIQAVPGLRARRDGVKPSRKIRPVPLERIQAILPHVNATIGAMVQVQALTGMRPGETWRMTTGQIDRTGELWLYVPTEHKTIDDGFERVIPLGPMAQEILKPWLKADPDAILFSPIEASARHYQEQRDRRRTPIYPSSRKRRGRKRGPKRTPRATYNKNSYAQAIERGCIRAGVPIFRPNQIRHTLATRVRREFSLEHAQVVLGHTKADVTQRYAERDMALARDVALKIG